MSVLRERWTDEKFEQAQRVSCLRLKQKKSKKIEAIADSLGYLTLWFLWTLSFLIELDFHLRQFVGKW